MHTKSSIRIEKIQQDEINSLRNENVQMLRAHHELRTDYARLQDKYDELWATHVDRLAQISDIEQHRDRLLAKLTEYIG